jgi:hypothetical protein
MALDSPDQPGALDIDLIAASLRAGGVRVERQRERMLGPKLVRRIAVDAGDQRLELRRYGGSIQTTCSRVSAGIVLKSGQVSTDEWMAALGQALAEQARRSQATRQALERLLNG